MFSFFSSNDYDIDQTEFEAKIGQKDHIVLDVRTADERSAGSLQNSVHIDFFSPNFDQEIDKLDRNKTYLVYCRSGNRSGQAIKKMQGMGFKKYFNLKSGLMSWV